MKILRKLRHERIRAANGRAGMSGAADGTTAIMRARLTGLIGLIVGLILGRSRVVTDRSRMQGIGGGDAGGPTCSDRRQDLHGQGNQDDRQEIPQPPAHQLSPPFSDIAS